MADCFEKYMPVAPVAEQLDESKFEEQLEGLNLRIRSRKQILDNMDKAARAYTDRSLEKYYREKKEAVSKGFEDMPFNESKEEKHEVGQEARRAIATPLSDAVGKLLNRKASIGVSFNNDGSLSTISDLDLNPSGSAHYSLGNDEFIYINSHSDGKEIRYRRPHPDDDGSIVISDISIKNGKNISGKETIYRQESVAGQQKYLPVDREGSVMTNQEILEVMQKIFQKTEGKAPDASYPP